MIPKKNKKEEEERRIKVTIDVNHPKIPHRDPEQTGRGSGRIPSQITGRPLVGQFILKFIHSGRGAVSQKVFSNVNTGAALRQCTRAGACLVTGDSDDMGMVTSQRTLLLKQG